MTDGNDIVISAINNGTVIDHIPPGEALIVLKILGITGRTDEEVSVATNVISKISGKKDVVKIENRELKQSEVDKISLVAPDAKINIIRNCRVVSKKGVTTPKVLVGMLKCPNPDCVTNTSEPVKTRFSREEGRWICGYCETIISLDIQSHLR